MENAYGNNIGDSSENDFNSKHRYLHLEINFVDLAVISPSHIRQDTKCQWTFYFNQNGEIVVIAWCG